MTVATALAHRVAQWCDLLDQHGYDLVYAEAILSVGALRICAKRRALHGGPAVTIYILEVLVAGFDPQRLAPIVDGFHIRRSSWHAQIGGPRDVDAERLDLDRSKPPHLVRHRHPHGHPNTRREPTTKSTPAAWLAHVETTAASFYPGRSDSQSE